MSCTEATPGTLRLVHGVPNPNGAEEARLFLLVGNPAAAPVAEIVPADGVEFPPPPALVAGAGSPRRHRLCILHFNDLHGHVTRSMPRGSDATFARAVFSRMVGRVRELRRASQEDPRLGVLFLSGGDDLAGGALGELLALQPSIHAGYRLYSAAGVDAGVLGNHDLDGGPAALARAIGREAKFPLLSANVHAAALAGRVYPAAILVIKDVRIGLIGLTTRAEVRHSPDLELSHPLIALQNLLPALRPRCDVLVVLSHLGHSLAAINASLRDTGDVELAAGLPARSVHLIVGGHTHDALNEASLGAANLVNGIPIVQAGAMGRFLGQVDIVVGKEACVTGVHLTPTADLPLDEAFEREQVQPLLAQAQPLLGRRLGRVADHPDLMTEALHAGFAAGESALANLISDALVDRCRAAGHEVDLAAIDASSICCGLPVGGELTFGDWFNLMPYADTVRLYRLTGQQLAGLLHDNARRADRPGEPHVERGFLQFSRQVRYTVQLGESRRAARAIEVTVDGQPLDRQPDRVFVLACTSFVREAAAPWERYVARQLDLPGVDVLGSPYADTDLLVRDLLIAHLRAHGGATEGAGARRDGRLRMLRSGPPSRQAGMREK
ncbi:MAG: 5'-nucleotidase C-terminal domain-containing protein [Anaerolineae bacterium]|nr:5'-nucleotidase C-terminal domain-containing protein [Anaerolineae bacterium]